MKKIAGIILALTMILAFTGCGKKDAAEPLPPEDGERNLIYSYVDGMDVSDGKNTYEDVKNLFKKQTVAGSEYYAVSLIDFCPYNISSVKGVFAETTDGFVKYYNDINNVYLLSFESKDGNFTPIKDMEGKSSFAIVTDEGKAAYIAGVTNVYMVTTPADFSVSVQIDGTEVGKINMSAFMKKTPVGDKKVTTGMYDGSFLYNGGDSRWTGRFLGITMDTMLEKLRANDMAVPSPLDCKNIEFNGYVGMGVKAETIEVNQNYSKDPESKNYFGNVSFYCMYDGYTKNEEIKQTQLGLTSFINGTGSKWITYNLTSINFVTK